ncbi:TIGR02281 family clan AA aspartic protease [Novosphingobium sp.]|uniref:retropepsin-like aspartic protease family protein n=1 Tax=Novosphingobium sp. TaxID=1874826 RepID=UPI0025CE4238|nr:TIGR02281 family clan AA aspartic protease [Novosphingobium sp.]
MVNRFVVLALSAIVSTVIFAPRLPTKSATFSSTSQPDDPVAPRHHARESQGGSNAMVLERDGSGQFRLTATIDNEDVSFLVDTGADLVALTEDTANRLGLLPPEDEFQPVMKTASGTGYGAPIMLETVEVGGERFRNVEAVVMKGLQTDLLGQSVLRRMGGVELQGDSMVIRPS